MTGTKKSKNREIQKIPINSETLFVKILELAK
jgi:hypothetical protein